MDRTLFVKSSATVACLLLGMLNTEKSNAQQSEGSVHSQDVGGIQTSAGEVRTDTGSVLTVQTVKFTATQSSDNENEDKIISGPLYGTEAIPHLAHVIPELPAPLQSSLNSDPKISKCITETNNYNSNVYKTRHPDSQTAETIREHDQYCLTRFPPQSAVFTLNPDFKAVGTLYSRSMKSYYCTATLVSDHLLVTARHCAYLPSSSDAGVSENSITYSLNLPSDIIFYSIAKPSTEVQVSSFVDENETAVSLPASLPGLNQANDVVFMKVQGTVVGVLPASIAAHRPEVGQQMIIPGYYARLANLDGINQQGGATHPASGDAIRQSWTDFMRYDGLGTCRVVRVGLQCIFNGCQSDPGWSGAPVFTDDGTNTGKLVISGVLSGSLVDNSDCKVELGENNASAFGSNSNVPNVAVVVFKH